MLSSRSHPLLETSPHVYSPRSLVGNRQRDSWLVLSPQARASINQRVKGLSPKDSIEPTDFWTSRFTEKSSPQKEGVGRKPYVTPKLKKPAFKWHLTARKPVQGQNLRVVESIPNFLRTEKSVHSPQDRSVEVRPEYMKVKLPSIGRVSQAQRKICRRTRGTHPIEIPAMTVLAAAGMTPAAWTPDPSYSSN